MMKTDSHYPKKGPDYFQPQFGYIDLNGQAFISPFTATCRAALGMNSKMITDDQLQASSIYENDSLAFGPQNARWLWWWHKLKGALAHQRQMKVSHWLMCGSNTLLCKPKCTLSAHNSPLPSPTPPSILSHRLPPYQSTCRSDSKQLYSPTVQVKSDRGCWGVVSSQRLTRGGRSLWVPPAQLPQHQRHHGGVHPGPMGHWLRPGVHSPIPPGVLTEQQVDAIP